jgi:hypothetical protein
LRGKVPRAWIQYVLIGLAAIPMSGLCLVATASGVRESVAVTGSAMVTLVLALGIWFLKVAQPKNEIGEIIFSALAAYIEITSPTAVHHLYNR